MFGERPVVRGYSDARTARLREACAARRPRHDAVPELLAFIAHLLLLGTILWALGFPF